MFRLQLFAVILLLSISMCLLLVADALNNDSSLAASLMTAPENCVDLCMFHIRPGKSTVRDAMALLKNHQWVDDIVVIALGTGYAEINWGWSQLRPEFINDTRRGQATFYYTADPMEPSLNDSIIETVTFYTHIPIYTFQEWFGETSIGNVNRLVDDKLGYTVYYDAPGGIINLTAEMVCPATIVSYWNAKTRITISIGSSTNPYTLPADAIRLC